MTTPATETQPPATPAPADPPPVQPPAQPPATPTAPPSPPAQQDLPDEPEALKAEIARLRRENASSRTNAKQTAAEEARKELAQQIGKALGIVEDETDPTKLAEQVAASTTEAKQARLELAVYQAAAASNVDPSALLDSRTFLVKLANVDPTDTTAIAAAIGEAVTANPALARTPALPGVPAPNPAQGASASGGGTAGPAQLTEADVKRLYAEKKYAEIEKARTDGRLNDYLGIKSSA